MGVKIDWLNKDNTAIRYDFNGKWNWTDFEKAVEQSFTMTESVTHTVHAVMDFSQHKTAPDGLMVYFKRKLAVLPENRGAIVFVSRNTALLTALRMFLRIHKSHADRVLIANDLKAAQSLLDEINTAALLPDAAIA